MQYLRPVASIVMALSVSRVDLVRLGSMEEGGEEDSTLKRSKKHQKLPYSDIYTWSVAEPVKLSGSGPRLRLQKKDTYWKYEFLKIS